jgi:hypothetical protein
MPSPAQERPSPLPRHRRSRRRSEDSALVGDVAVDDDIIIDVDGSIVIEVPVAPSARAPSFPSMRRVVVDVQPPIKVGVPAVGVSPGVAPQHGRSAPH